MRWRLGSLSNQASQISDGANSIFSRDTGSVVGADADPVLNSIDSDGNALAGMLAAPFAIGESSQGPSATISSWSSALTPSLSVVDVRAGADFSLTQLSFVYGADASVPAATDSATIKTSATTRGDPTHTAAASPGSASSSDPALSVYAATATDSASIETSATTGGDPTNTAAASSGSASASDPALSVYAANPADVMFTVSGLASDYSGTVTFTDTLGKSDVVPIGADGTYSANLSNSGRGHDQLHDDGERSGWKRHQRGSDSHSR